MPLRCACKELITEDTFHSICSKLTYEKSGRKKKKTRSWMNELFRCISEQIEGERDRTSACYNKNGKWNDNKMKIRFHVYVQRNPIYFIPNVKCIHFYITSTLSYCIAIFMRTRFCNLYLIWCAFLRKKLCSDDGWQN